MTLNGVTLRYGMLGQHLWYVLIDLLYYVILLYSLSWRVGGVYIELARLMCI